MTNGKNCWFLPFCFIVFFFWGGGGLCNYCQIWQKDTPKTCYYGIGTTFCQNHFLPGFNYIGPIPHPPPPTSLWNPFSEMINITRVTTKIKEGWHYILCLPSCEKNQVSLLTHHMRCWWCHATQRISRMSNHAFFSLLIELKLCEQEVRLRRGE